MYFVTIVYVRFHVVHRRGFSFCIPTMTACSVPVNYVGRNNYEDEDYDSDDYSEDEDTEDENYEVIDIDDEYSMDDDVSLDPSDVSCGSYGDDGDDASSDDNSGVETDSDRDATISEEDSFFDDDGVEEVDSDEEYIPSQLSSDEDDLQVKLIKNQHPPKQNLRKRSSNVRENQQKKKKFF